VIEVFEWLSTAAIEPRAQQPGGAGAVAEFGDVCDYVRWRACPRRSTCSRSSMRCRGSAGSIGQLIRIREVDHIVLRVRELQPMLDFYCQVLGCSVERQQDEIGLVQLRAGRSLLGLIPADGPLGRAGSASPAASARNLDHLCLRVRVVRRARRSAPTSAAHGITAGRRHRAAAPKARGRRSTSPIRRQYHRTEGTALVALDRRRAPCRMRRRDPPRRPRGKREGAAVFAQATGSRVFPARRCWPSVRCTCRNCRRHRPLTRNLHAIVMTLWSAC